MTKVPLLVDTDAAADDMLAILLALRSSQVSLDAITVVSGACRVDQGMQNVSHLLQLRDQNVPVFGGRAKPMFGPLRDSGHVMGQDGLGGLGPDIDCYPVQKTPACDAIRRFIKNTQGRGTIVCLGPLTNLALSLLSEPSLASKLGRLVIMGGVSDGIGNITPAAEFNIWADPEAAKAVFESGIVLELVGWDVARKPDTQFSPSDLERIEGIGSPIAKFSVGALSGLRSFLARTLNSEMIDLPDPIAMAVALNPTIATRSALLHVAVETGFGPSRGATIVDHLGTTGRSGNARIVTDVDKAQVLDMLCEAVAP